MPLMGMRVLAASPPLVAAVGAGAGCAAARPAKVKIATARVAVRRRARVVTGVSLCAGAYRGTSWSARGRDRFQSDAGFGRLFAPVGDDADGVRQFVAVARLAREVRGEDLPGLARGLGEGGA